MLTARLGAGRDVCVRVNGEATTRLGPGAAIAAAWPTLAAPRGVATLSAALAYALGIESGAGGVTVTLHAAPPVEAPGDAPALRLRPMVRVGGGETSGSTAAALLLAPLFGGEDGSTAATSSALAAVAALAARRAAGRRLAPGTLLPLPLLGRTLGLEVVAVNAVADYWCDVFSPFASAVAAGLTPNPDLACNAVLKFGSLARRVVGEMGADALATGHYARVRWGGGSGGGSHNGFGGGCGPNPGSSGTSHESDTDPWASRPWDSSSLSSPPPSLLVGVDAAKDQSYFLASVPGDALRTALFPVGGLTKAAVRSAVAAHPALAAALAGRRSSAGICFVGRRRFGEFMEGYADPVPGQYRSVGPAGVRVGGGDEQG